MSKTIDYTHKNYISNNEEDVSILATSPPIEIPTPKNSLNKKSSGGFFGGWWGNNKNDTSETIQNMNEKVLEENSEGDECKTVEHSSDIDDISNGSSEQMFEMDDIKSTTIYEFERNLERKDDSGDDSGDDFEEKVDSDDDVCSEIEEFEEDLACLKFGYRFYDCNDYVRRNRKRYSDFFKHFKQQIKNDHDMVLSKLSYVYEEYKDVFALSWFANVLCLMGLLEYSMIFLLSYWIIFSDKNVKKYDIYSVTDFEEEEINDDFVEDEDEEEDNQLSVEEETVV